MGPTRLFFALLGTALVCVAAACGGPGTAAPSRSTTSRPTTARGGSTRTVTAPPTTSCVTSVSGWPLTRLVNQLLLVSGEYADLSASEPEAAAGVGGFVLFGEPPSGSGTSIRSGIAALERAAAAAGDDAPWMSTDTEGGTVSRLADVLGPIPSARQMGSQWSPAQVQAQGASRGTAMRALGMTMDLAPVLDTASPTDPVADESTRSFSATPQVAAADGIAFADGLRSAGVVPVVKHFPGLGHASADTDTARAEDPPLSALRNDDLIPFERAVDAGVPVVMVGHPMVPGLSTSVPASLAAATYRFLRQTLHFTGVAITDSLAAGAVSAAGYSQPTAAAAVLEAGADMALIDASTWQPAVAAVEHAVTAGTLPLAQLQASARRVLTAKGVRTCSS